MGVVIVISLRWRLMNGEREGGIHTMAYSMSWKKEVWTRSMARPLKRLDSATVRRRDWLFIARDNDINIIDQWALRRSWVCNDHICLESCRLIWLNASAPIALCQSGVHDDNNGAGQTLEAIREWHEHCNWDYLVDEERERDMIKENAMDSPKYYSSSCGGEEWDVMWKWCKRWR